jgi:hypothetical protein
LSGISGTSTSWHPKGLSRPVAGKLYLLLYNYNSKEEKLYDVKIISFYTFQL